MKDVKRATLGALTALLALGAATMSNAQDAEKDALDPGVVPDPAQFQVYELRRYVMKPGQVPSFQIYFETYFPEAFQQLGALIFGTFESLSHKDEFVWLRGYPNMEARLDVLLKFHKGPLWYEHRQKMNARNLSYSNVFLLQPAHPGTEVIIPPAVDPLLEPDGAKGKVMVQIFPVVDAKRDDAEKAAEALFSSYRDLGARDAGLLYSLDVENNFPVLPVREDIPFLVWIGVFPDGAQPEKAVAKIVAKQQRKLKDKGLLRDDIETLWLRPGSRSRLRDIEPQE